MSDCPLHDDQLPGADCTCPPATAAAITVNRIADVADFDPMPYPLESPDRPPKHWPAEQWGRWDEYLAAARWLAMWNREAQLAADANPHRRGTTRARKGTLRKGTW